MTDAQIALLMSGAALAVSISGFIWSIWKEFIYVKPRVYVSFAVMEIFHPELPRQSICTLTATNMGPGSATLHSCITGEGWFRRKATGILNPIHGHPAVLPHRSLGPFSDGLPFELAPGKTKSFHFPFEREIFLKDPITWIGVHDTYGRSHWAKRQDVVSARERYWRDFPRQQ